MGKSFSRLFGGGGSSPAPPPEIVYQPVQPATPAEEQAQAEVQAKKRRPAVGRDRTRTVFTGPLGYSGTAALTRKRLLGE